MGYLKYLHNLTHGVLFGLVYYSVLSADLLEIFSCIDIHESEDGYSFALTLNMQELDIMLMQIC